MSAEPRVSRIRTKSEVEADTAWVEAEPQPATETKPRGKPTPRMLRRARRKATALGLRFESDEAALQMLLDRGIDPNTKDSMLEMVPPTQAPDNTTALETPPEMLAPGAAPNQPQAPANDASRASEIAKIQRQLVVRRRKRLALLLLKLFFFVALPTLLVGNYYYTQAAPMYESKAEFVIQKSESGAGGGIGGLFSGTGFATSQDSITVQGYLTSREAMRRLDADHGFISHFQNEEIDAIQRLPRDATEEQAYKLYKRRVTVGFDPTEGIIRLDVTAANPEAATAFSNALIGYAEERVDNLSARVRQDQMAGARESYERAEADMKSAQERVLALQQTRGVLSAEAEVSSQMSIINSMELERESRALDLAEILANPRPNQTRVDTLTAEIARLDARVAQLRARLTESSDTSLSLARVTAELRVAETDLANRQLMMQTALQQMETARIEANRQVRYLSLGVAPVVTDTAAYPRKFENTALAFVIFLSLYILVSLTVSILREQVSV